MSEQQQNVNRESNIGKGAARQRPKAANDRINFACIGVGGKGDSDSNDASNFGNIVAICDVAQSNFPDYASPLAETILLGNLAVWVAGEKIEWDAENMQARNGRELADRVEHIIRPPYRAGFSL